MKLAWDTLAYGASPLAGELDVDVDYSGTILFNVMKAGPRPADRVLPEVEAFLRERHDIRIAARLGFENRYAFALPEADARRLGVRTLSDLTAHAPRLELVASYEFYDRPEWAAVRRAYGLRFAERTTMEMALAYEAVRSGARDAMVAFSTDGRVDAYGLRLLEDDRRAIPPYDAIVLVRGAFADAHPEAMAALAELEGALAEQTVRALNRSVDEGAETPRSAALGWLGEAAP